VWAFDEDIVLFQLHYIMMQASKVQKVSCLQEKLFDLGRAKT